MGSLSEPSKCFKNLVFLEIGLKKLHSNHLQSQGNALKPDVFAQSRETVGILRETDKFLYEILYKISSSQRDNFIIKLSL